MARKPCAIEGCGKPSDARGYCNAHYARWRKYGSPTGGSTRTQYVGPWKRLTEAALTYADAEGDDAYQRAQANLRDAARAYAKRGES
jgi:hypothetical protein